MVYITLSQLLPGNQVMMKQMLGTTLVVALFTLSLDVVAASRPATTEEDTKLRIISVTMERLEAEFYSLTGGIHILSEVHSGSEAVRVSITSINGESIFAVDRPIDHTQSLLSIVGNEFLIVNETSDNSEAKLTEYVVPEAYSLRVKNALKHHRLPNKLLRHLDRETVNATGQSAIEDLMMRPEVQLIAAAAVALGETGLHGIDNPAAMAFYSTAWRFSTDLEGNVNKIPSEDAVPVEDVPSEIGARYRREYCSYADSNCPSGMCPRGRNCRGLCGPGCSCWWWVCRDCCWNRGCYEHDVEDCAGGFTFRCFITAPLVLFRCS